MSGTTLANFGVGSNTVEQVDSSRELDWKPKLGFETPQSPTLHEEIQAAREVDWVVYTGRYPHVFDAARLGFGIGHREDSSYQWTPDEVDLPVHFLDNDYRDADLDRFVERVLEHEPEIAVLGDLYNADDLGRHIDAAERVWEQLPETHLILVPKCNEALHAIPEEFILGFPNGTSDVQALDLADYREWRELPHQIHILGGTPLSAHDHIVGLTRETVTSTPRADVVGLDWNGYQKFAENHGDYAAADGGWHRNLRDEYPPKRDLIRYSLLNAKHYWASRSVWPESDDLYLPTRDELLEANTGGPVDVTDQDDCREMFFSPLPDTDRRGQPIYRTDDTQTRIIEPLSPIAALLSTFHGEEWSPAGSLSQPVRYQNPTAHHIEPVCTGCGAHVFIEPECCNVDHSKESITVQVVSYEHQPSDRDEHYESVATDGPATLEARTTFPAIHCFCSDECRKRAEYQSPHLLIDLDPTESTTHPNGKVVGEISVPLSDCV